MTRSRYYMRALASGYVTLAANLMYTLASVPLALRYLSNEEFGLWALISQLAGYVALLDFGMGGAAMRILIDFKDRKESPEYGSTILTGSLVNLVQGAIILAVGVGLAHGLEPLLGVPDGMRTQFWWLVFWQCAFQGINLALRMASMMLTAHQRYDVANLSQASCFGVSFGVLWVCFATGGGVFSLLWAQAVGQLLGAAAAVGACFWLKLWPRRGCWGRPAWVRFWDLFSFGRDMLLYSVGYQLINASQTFLLVRVLGLEAAAVWSVCTRAFFLAALVIYRLFDFACAALAEMIVREERDRLSSRFRSIIVLSGSLSVVAGVGIAVANEPFVAWWTNGRIAWPPWNDWMLGLWLPVLVLVRSHTGLVGLTKEFRFMRFLYFLEGLFFVAVTLAVLPHGGPTAMLAASLGASLLFSFPYSIWRTSGYFGINWREVLEGWMRPCARLAVALVPTAAVTALLSAELPPLPRLLACSGVPGVTGALFLLRWGLDEPMRQELRRRWPTKWARLGNWLGVRTVPEA